MFIVKFTGQIECIQISSPESLCCKYWITHGPDWEIANGQIEGISQVSTSSTNPFGWPQLIVAIYGPDLFGREIVRGYGSIHLPLCVGKSVLYIDLFVPCSSATLNSILGFLVGRPPEFIDPKFVAKSQGRQVSRVQSDGTVKVVINCIMKDFDKYFDI